MPDDMGSGLMARLEGGAKRTGDGLVLNGKKGYFAKLDTWELGGTTYFETYGNYESFDVDCARVIESGLNDGHDGAFVCNSNDGGRTRIYWGVYQRSNYKGLRDDSTCFELA